MAGWTHNEIIQGTISRWDNGEIFTVGVNLKSGKNLPDELKDSDGNPPSNIYLVVRFIGNCRGCQAKLRQTGTECESGQWGRTSSGRDFYAATMIRLVIFTSAAILAVIFSVIVYLIKRIMYAQLTHVKWPILIKLLFTWRCRWFSRVHARVETSFSLLSICFWQNISRLLSNSLHI